MTGRLSLINDKKVRDNDNDDDDDMLIYSSSQ